MSFITGWVMSGIIQTMIWLLSSVISHFKFVSGMNVGEKRRSQLGSCDYDCGDVTVLLKSSSTSRAAMRVGDSALTR